MEVLRFREEIRYSTYETEHLDEDPSGPFILEARSMSQYLVLKRSLRKWLYGKCPMLRGSFPYYGVKVFFPKNSYAFHLACEQGVYEHQNVSLISSLVRPGTAYLDIGANIGLMSIPVLHNCPTCRVTSFEPSPNSASFLRRTVAGSGLQSRWTVVEKAVGNQEGYVDFVTSRPEWGVFDGIRGTGRVERTGQVRVAITTIDAEWRAMGRPEVSVIKIDVEGAELQVLSGAQECMSQCKPFVVIEWSTGNLPAYECDPRSLLLFAKSVGYLVYSLPDLVPVSEFTTLWVHMQLTEHFLLASAKEETISDSHIQRRCPH